MLALGLLSCGTSASSREEVCTSLSLAVTVSLSLVTIKPNKQQSWEYEFRKAASSAFCSLASLYSQKSPSLPLFPRGLAVLWAGVLAKATVFLKPPDIIIEFQNILRIRWKWPGIALLYHPQNRKQRNLCGQITAASGRIANSSHPYSHSNSRCIEANVGQVILTPMPENSTNSSPWKQ